MRFPRNVAASYEFTTLTCIPGVKFWRGAKIQLLDLPGIIEGAKDGKGRGRQVIAVARTCSCIIIVLDALKPLQHKRIIEQELEGVGIRLNKKPPAITVKKKERGGLNLSTSCKLTHMDEVSATCRPLATRRQRPFQPALDRFNSHDRILWLPYSRSTRLFLRTCASTVTPRPMN